MLRNYLAAALRNLLRNRLYTAISVGGLAVAFAAALLIAIFVGDEFSYDRWIPGAKDVYRVSETYVFRDQPPNRTDETSLVVAGLLKLDFSQIAAVTRLYRDQRDVRHGQVETVESLLWADPDVFSVLPLPTVAGDPKTALAGPDSVVLTQAYARKYFGSDNPIGQALLIDKRFPMRVTAVIRDLPSNTHLKMTIIASSKAPFSTLARLDTRPLAERINTMAAYTYIRLRPGSSVQPIADRMTAFVAAHMPDNTIKDGEGMTLQVVPLAAIHFSPRAEDAFAPRGDLTATWSMTMVGALIVLMAAVNFVNLMTARAGRRAVEVGVRKAAGAARRDLIVQFIGEALIHAALAGLIAMALAEALLPSLNAFLSRRMAFPYDLALPVLLGLVVLIGGLAGAYPAVVLSSFRPALALKGGMTQVAGRAALRQGLVAFQFAVLVGLIISTAVIWRQTTYAINESLRRDNNQILTVFAPCASDAFRSEIAVLPGVIGAACSQRVPLSIGSTADAISAQGRLENIYVDSVGFGFFELYGLKPLAGRFFSRAHVADLVPDVGAPSPSEAVVVNRTAAFALGFGSPAAAVGKTFDWTRGRANGVLFAKHPARIIGVVEDFPMNSIRTRIEPAAFYVEPEAQQMISFKVRGRDAPQTLNALKALWRKFGFTGPVRGAHLDVLMRERYRDITQEGQLFGVFAGIAIFIACLGLVGLAAFATERRTKEVGIRKAVGASAFDVLKLFLWQFTVPVLWANLVAWPLAFLAMSRWLQGFAYRIPLTLWPFALAAAAAVVIAWLTVLAQASRAARSRPVAALRYE
jgi:putative ABC transport system permease protein